jgi:SPP1 family predicted phage head-tail adaptor
MSAGRRNCFVSVERKTGARDADGGERVVWILVNKYWASILPLNGSESLGAAQKQSEVSGKMVFLYPVDLSAADRITYDGKAYNVHAVMETKTRREVTAMVSEGVSDGR